MHISTQISSRTISFEKKKSAYKRCTFIRSPPDPPKMKYTMSTSNREVVQELQEILRQWEDDNAVTTRDPTPHLIKLCELFERETVNFMKKDPDPFDDRHPATSEPDCALGQILRVLFKKEAFVNKLVGNYLRDNYFSSQGVQTDATELNTSACRLLLDLLHGFDIPHVFNESETTVMRFFTWAEKGPEPLCTFATGLLAAAMDIPEIAASFRDQNAHLVPIMLKRLWDLKDDKHMEIQSSGPNSGIASEANSTPSEALLGLDENVPERPFALFNKNSEARNELANGEVDNTNKDNEEEGPARKKVKESPPECVTPTKHSNTSGTFNIFGSPKANRDLFDPSLNSDCSNSSWAEMSGYIMGTYQMYPINKDTKQMFILKYLRPVGEYQESLGHVYEHNAMELIFHYINVRKTGNARISYEALRFLGSLLLHKKFCLEFVKMGGMQKLLAVPRPSLPADGVALCLWYLAYCEEAVERICLLPDQMLSELVRYTLWLLECSHQSSRQHAVMFFGMVFRFRAMLDRFDEQDGLRKMTNMLSTLSLFQDVWEQDLLDEPNEVIMWHTVKQVCLSVKNYFEAHLAHKVQNFQRTRVQGSVQQQTPLAYKAVNVSTEVVERNVEYLLENLPFRARWKPVEQFVTLKGLPLFLQLVAIIINDSCSQNRAETAVYALETLYVCTVMPQIQSALCDKLTLPPGDDLLQTLDPQEVPGYAILVACIHESTQSLQSTPEIQKSALGVLINCLCAPIHRSAGGSNIRSSSSSSTPSGKKSKSGTTGEDLINKSWDCVRTSNGIMYLLNVLNKKVPITDADCIRGLACHALVGLSRSDTARQIMSKLPMLTSGTLQLLMKEPILQDKRIEHVKFQRHALELIKAVSGRIKQKNGSSMDISMQSIHKADVVAQTRINYNKRQLLQLIQMYLNQEGFESISTALQQVAHLPAIPPPHALMGPPSRNMATPPPSSRHRINSQRNLFSPGASKNAISNLSNGSLANTHADSPSPPPVNSPSSGPSHIKITRKSKRDSFSTSSLSVSNSNNLSNLSNNSNMYGRNEGSLCATTSVPGITGNISSSNISNLCYSDPSISLDRIVTEYLMNQHALCKNPVVTCPTFDLFQPHSCPEPRSQKAAPTNFTMRYARKGYGMNGNDAAILNRKYIYSRYRPTQVYRQADDDDIFVCCEFTPDDQFIIAGTTRGDVRLFSKNGATEEGVYTVHQGAVSSLVPHNSGNLLLTSCTSVHETSLWSISDMFEFKFSLEECHHADFNNAQDKIIGTSDQTARLYDLNTSSVVCEFTPKLSNHYRINKAVLDPTDALMLTDGVLFDVRSGKQIHKFDKINPTLNGIFHRNGLEILSSSEIWDLRTFHLLRTVPSLNLCDVIFNHSNDVIFGVTVGDDQQDNAFETSFKTVDAADYSSIVTFDVRRVVSSLAINRTDTQIAIVETETGSDDLSEDAVVRLYEIGMTRQEDDELVDEDEEEIGSDDDSDDSDDDAQNSQNDGGSGAENDDGDDNSSSISNLSIQSYEEDLDDGSDDDQILFELRDNSNENSNQGADPLDQWLQNNQDDEDDDQDYDQDDDDDDDDDDDNDVNNDDDLL